MIPPAAASAIAALCIGLAAGVAAGVVITRWQAAANVEHMRAQVAQAQAATSAAVAQAQAAARERERQMSIKSQEAADAYRAQAARAARAAADLRGERDRLLVAVDQTVPAACAAPEAASAAGRADGPAGLRLVVRECADALAQVAAAADASDARLIGLQAYVRAVVDTEIDK